ncbi:MAG: glycoside hydrolase family 31 protein [Ancrocorticia sp.]
MANYDNYVRYTQLHSVHETPTGILGELHGEFFRIDVIRGDVLRFKISRGGVFDEEPTYAVSADLGELTADFSAEISDERAVVTTSSLVATVGLDPFRVDVHRTDGTPVFETAPRKVAVFGTSLSETAGSGTDGFLTYATLNDAFTFSRRRNPSDAIFGLGEKTGAGNRSGRDFTLWNVDVLNPTASGEFASTHTSDDPRSNNRSTEFDPYYMSIPFFYHRDAATGAMSGSFVDNGYRAAYDFSLRGRFEVHFSGGQYTEYVFAGPSMQDILEAYTWLTGRMNLPPLWSLGYQQCRWAKYHQDDVLAIADRLRAEAVPCDGLWLDIEYMDGYRVFTWNNELFPDPHAMISELAEDGFTLTTIVDPGVKWDPGYSVYDQAQERDVLCRTEGGDTYIGQVWPGNTAFPDFATEEGRAWWGELNAAHVASGIAGIWNDMNEPATGNISPLGMLFDKGRASHERYHNQYAMLMAMGTVQGLLKERPNDRTFVLSRAGSPGIQRYAANWMGDNMSNWEHLALSLPMAAGLGVSGQAFVGADIGGFAGSSNPELFARWIQYGALTPFCRNHSVIGQHDQYPWSFGPAVLDIAREALQLRYRLMPYIYSAFVEAAEFGTPVQRPLILEDQYDGVTADIDDQYLFGPNLLVAPVLEPGATQRSVYLPGGAWYDWHTDEVLGGQRFLAADAPLDRIPLYARAGSVISMWSEAPATTVGYRPEEVELHVFTPVADGEYESFLQEDDGQSLAATHGAHLRTRFVVARAGDAVTLRAETSGDGFPEFARKRFVVVVHDGTDAEKRVTIENAGTGFSLDLGAL